MAIYARVRRMRLRERLSISEIARRTSLSTIESWPREPVRSKMKYRRPVGPKKITGYAQWLREVLETAARPRQTRRT